MLKELFPGSTDFTEAIFKIPGISKHFSAMLTLLESKSIFEIEQQTIVACFVKNAVLLLGIIMIEIITVEYASQELHSLCALTLKSVFS